MEVEQTQEFPRDLHIAEDAHIKYLYLEKSEIFSEYDAPFKHIFIYAMALGFYSKSRLPLGKKRASIPTDKFTAEDKWLIRSILVSEKKELEVLADVKNNLNIVEEYANGGIETLYNLILDPYSPGFHYKRLDANAAEALHKSKPEGKPKEDIPITDMELRDIIKSGENEKIEFKSCLCWDIKQNNRNKAIEAANAKEIAAFLNANGGTLLIGIADDKQILGLEKDFSKVNNQNQDGFELQLIQIINKYIGTQFGVNVHSKFKKIEDKIICVVTIDRARRPAYFKDGDRTEFYVRVGNSSQPLGVREANEYISEHFSEKF